MEYRIAVIPGDGIGPEIVTEAKKVLDRVGQVFGHTFHYTEVDMGGVSIDKYGVPLTKEALETAKTAIPSCLEPWAAMWAIPAGMTWLLSCVRRPGSWRSERG